jgi:hypothetical protein
LGTRLDGHAEAEALIEYKREGQVWIIDLTDSWYTCHISSVCLSSLLLSIPWYDYTWLWNYTMIELWKKLLTFVVIVLITYKNN